MCILKFSNHFLLHLEEKVVTFHHQHQTREARNIIQCYLKTAESLTHCCTLRAGGVGMAGGGGVAVTYLDQ